MQYSIELYYDEETEKKLSALAQKVADEKLSTKFIDWNTRPHLTLACFNDVDEEKCIELLKEFANNHKVMPAYIGSVGMFNDTKTIFVSPIMNKNMYQFHDELHTALKKFDSASWEWYYPDRWIPHSTIALTQEDADEVFYKVSDLILHEFEKIDGEFTAIGLTKITFPAYPPLEEICAIALCR